MSKEELDLDQEKSHDFFRDLTIVCDNLTMELDRLQQVAILVDYMRDNYPNCKCWLSAIGNNIEEASEAIARALDCTQGDLDQITKPNEDYD